jgi:hypothetical protein
LRTLREEKSWLLGKTSYLKQLALDLSRALLLQKEEGLAEQMQHRRRLNGILERPASRSSWLQQNSRPGLPDPASRRLGAQAGLFAVHLFFLCEVACGV